MILRESGEDSGDELVQTLRNHVAHDIGPIAKPRQIMVVQELPKTRSGKIMRRLLRDIAENRELGDVTTLTDSSVMNLIKEKLPAAPVRGLKADPDRRTLAAGPSAHGRSCGTIPLTSTTADRRRSHPWPTACRRPRVDRSAAADEPSIGTLVQSAMADVSTLMRAEIELAKAEVGKSAKKAGIGAGAFGAAGVVLAFSGLLLRHRARRVPHLAGPERWISYLIVWFLLVLARRRRRAGRAPVHQEDREARAHARDAARPARGAAPRGARRSGTATSPR